MDYNNLKEQIALSKANNSSDVQIKIPEPPPAATLQNKQRVLDWIVTLPTLGGMRDVAKMSFYRGMELDVERWGEVPLAKGNLGAIQRWIDNWTSNLDNVRTSLVNNFPIIYKYDAKGNLITNFQCLEPSLVWLGNLVKSIDVANKWKADVLVPFPDSTDPTPKIILPELKKMLKSISGMWLRKRWEYG